MANVHRIGEYQNNNNNNQGAGYNQFGQNLGGIGGPITDDPRGDNFYTMLKNSLCPKILLLSFTTFVVCLITSLYISMLSLDGYQENLGDTAFLYVKTKELENFGGNDAYKVKYNGALYLWFTSIFLIPCFYDWIISIIMIMIFYSFLESLWGTKLAALVYVGGGAMGALFGDLCSCCGGEAKSEVFSSVYAAMGAFLGIFILSWNKLAVLGEIRGYLVCIFGMIFFLIVLFSQSAQQRYIDNYGKLGGIIAGVGIGMAATEIQPFGEYEKTVKLVGLGLLGILFGLSIILLYSLSY